MKHETFHPFPFSAVSIRGDIRKRMELTAEKMLRHIDVENVFVCHYRERKPEPWKEVRGGFTGYGMFLDAAVKAAAHGIGGQSMVEFKTFRLHELIGTQTPDGSITIYADKPGFWDNHDQAYLIQAMVNDHRFFGCEESLEAAHKLGNFLLGIHTKPNLGLETAFLMLARESGDERFLTYCREEFRIAESMDVYDRILPVNGTAHVYTWIARVVAQLQYAELTGEKSDALFSGACELYRRIFSDYSSVTGTCTGGRMWGEVWDRTQTGRGRWGETCASAYLLRSTAKMFEFAPSSRLGDLYERVMYNALFGAQSEDGLRQRYFSPFDDANEWYEQDTYCCPNNLRRIMFELPDAVYFRTDDGVAVNLYTDSDLTTEGIRICQKTSYPESENILLSVESEKKFVLRLRIPLWCENAVLTVDGKKEKPERGAWFYLPLEAGTHQVSATFPMPVRVIRGRMAQTHRGALMRGPLVYAFKREENMLEKNHGSLDLLEIDTEKNILANGDTLSVFCRCPNWTHPEGLTPFVRFSAENHYIVYGELSDETRSVADELYSPEYWNVNKIEI